MDGVFSRANDELKNPMSPYYLGGYSSLENLDNYMYRGGYNTNYFGSNAYNYLAPRNCDTVEIYHREQEARRQRNIWTGIGIAALAIGGWLCRGKIPLIGKYLKKAKN